ncbi:MAG: ATP cone domain-containing protein [archaeon]
MTVERVVKRNGSVERFQSYKIVEGLEKSYAHARGRKKLIEKIWMEEIALRVHRVRPKQLSSDTIRKIIVDDLNTRKMNDIADHYDFSFLQESPSKIKKVLKRSGKTELFSPKKIFKSIRKAFSMTGIPRERECERVTKIIIRRLEKIVGNKPLPVEAIREVTEEALMETGHHAAAHRYMLHRYM